MHFWKMALLVCGTGLVLFLSRAEGTGRSRRAEGRSDCDHILPLMMMLGGAPALHQPNTWLLGMLSLGVVVLMGMSGNWMSWRSRGEREEKNKLDNISEISY